MRSWTRIVREQLPVLSICSSEFAETVVEEWASHLEDTYEEQVRSGVPEETAYQRTLDELERHSKLLLAIGILKEDRMTTFSRRIGLPGLLTFALAMVFALALDRAHIQPRTIYVSNGLFFSLPLMWMCLLPLCGAAGAVLSLRAGGTRMQCIAASLFPSGIMTAVLLLMFVAGFVISLFVHGSGWSWGFALPGLAVWLTASAILPAAPLLLGALAGERWKRSIHTD